MCIGATIFCIVCLESDDLDTRLKMGRATGRAAFYMSPIQVFPTKFPSPGSRQHEEEKTVKLFVCIVKKL